MTQVVCVANQKGGVGKTTTVVNIAHLLALSGRRTLVVDLDPQGNSTSVIEPLAHDEPHLLAGGRPVQTERDHLTIAAASQELHELREALSFDDRRHRQVLAQRLEDLTGELDAVLIDCPPSLDMLSINGLIAADLLLIPLQCEYFAMEGLGQILSLYEELRTEGSMANTRLRIMLVMHDEALILNQQVAAEVRGHLTDQVLATTIPRDVALAAAPSHRRTIIEHDPLAPGSIAYLEATREVLDVLG